ncbi:MAG TPA: glycosyltransferase family 4 protein [Acidimicrobiales bacterium]|nr:glycosyltransferase family 4 protein [Acidimicrobiales bacterium]
MRILQLSSLWPPTVLGGAELYASALTARLRAAGHEVGVVTLGVEGPDVVATVPAWPYRVEAYAGQPRWKRAAYHARDQYDPVAARVLSSAIARFDPDVVHSHAVPGLSVSAVVAPGRAGIPHVHTLHDYWLLCQRATLVTRDDRACIERCRGCRVISGARSWLLDRHPPEVALAVSEAVAEEHRRAGILGDRIRVVRNPVEAAPAPPPIDRQRPGIVLGYLGQLVPSKGVRTLLQAFGSLPAGTATLEVAGTGPLAELLDDAPGVVAAGWLDEPARDEFFGRIDALVVPSEWKDPAPLVVNEARARGVPVIGARTGGIPELVDPADDDLLFRSGDVDELRTRLAAFAAAPRMRRTPSGIGGGWAGHVEAVVAAYEHARRARARS